MSLVKVTKLFLTTLLFLSFTFITAHGQVKKNTSTAKKPTTTKKQSCPFCGGTGKPTGPVICDNCVSWSAEYKRKVACHVCKDTRRVMPKKCLVCDGTGKADLSFMEDGMKILKETLEEKKNDNSTVNDQFQKMEKGEFVDGYELVKKVQEQELKNQEAERIRRYGDPNASAVSDSLFKKIATPIVEKKLTYNNVLQKAANGMASPEIRSLIKDVSITWKVSIREASFDINERVIMNTAYLSEIIMNGNVIEKELFKNGKYQKSEQGRNREMNSEEKEETNMKTAFFDEAYLLNQTNYSFGLSGNWYVSGNEAHVLTITTPFGKKRTNYYDVASGLKLKSITTKETDRVTTEDLTVEQYFSDYKSYNGVMIPTKITIEQNGQYPIEISLVDVKFNTGLDAKDFK